MEIKLRPYQQKIIHETYAHFRAGKKRVIVYSATGSGKTFMFCFIAKEFVDYGHVVIVMSGRELVKQASRSLMALGADHSVHMSGDPRFNASKKIQVCSLDTLNSRGFYPHAEKENVLLIIDEQHRCTPRSKKYVKLLSEYEGRNVIGFSATPFADNSQFDAIVNPLTAKGAMDLGFLVPARVFVPNIIDVSNVRIKSTGDFDEKELFEAVSQNAVIGDVVSDWIKHGQNRMTLVFGVNIEHSKMLCEAFNERGIVTEHIDGKTSSRKRDAVFARLKAGKTKVLCNVGVLTTGFDLPAISCLVFARPTNSLILYVQILGRILRPSPETGKVDALILDNAGNVLRFGSPYKHRKATLEKQKGCKEPSDLTIRKCNACHYIFQANLNECPDCGYRNEPIKIDVKTASGELLELFLSDEEIDALKKSAFIKDFWTLKAVQKQRGLWHKFAEQKLEKKYGKEFYNEHKEFIK